MNTLDLGRNTESSGTPMAAQAEMRIYKDTTRELQTSAPIIESESPS